MTRYEGSKADRAADKVGMKAAGVKSDRAWEASTADKREDTLRDYQSYVRARQARKGGEPERMPFHVDAHGPYFKDKMLNRDGHDPFAAPRAKERT